MKVIAIIKYSSNMKDWSVEMPNAPYSNRYQQAEKRDREYENLLQEKHGIKAHAQIAHLFFANTQSDVEKTKELFLATAP